MDLISVIVPVYNVEKYLDRCVESIVNQSYKNLEIILVDDGSPDNCPAICDEWAKKDIRIKVIHKENGGLSNARNAGIKIATGEYISFIDSDDWIEPEMYSVLSNAISDTDSDVAACKFFKTSGKENAPSKSSKQEYVVYNRIQMQSELIDDKIIQQVVWNKIYRASKIKNVLFENGKYHEDEFWAYLALANCEKYVAVDYYGYAYFQREDSIMGEGYSLKRLDAVEAKIERCKYIKANFPALFTKAKKNLIATCIYHGQLALKYLPKDEKKQALIFLRETVKTYKLSLKQLKNTSLTAKIWITFAQINLRMCCNIKNILKVGM